jgi:hypothetical protein
MAHSVTFAAPKVEVSKLDYLYEISGADGKLGDLKISKGNIKWKPTGKSTNEVKLTWENFALMFETHGAPSKVPKKR